MTQDEAISQIESSMVSIPGGTFLMGSPADEPERHTDEVPQQKITLPEFEMSCFTVSFEQWDAIMGSEECRPDDEGWGRGNRPVINVSWNDVKALIERLNALSEKNYRLPSESEWEYACRAGTTTRFNTGGCITTDQANFDGINPAKGCPKGEYRKKTTPVGTFAPNAFGLYDMHGNVWEWTEDCFSQSMSGIPQNGSPRSNGNYGRRVLRGGSWLDIGWNLRSAIRYFSGRENQRFKYTGFRLARSKA